MANYPLQIILPIASGTTPDVGKTAIDSDHRIFWAYAGIEYNIRAAVIGGKFPYTFSLTNEPTGMTVDSSTGEISWIASGNGTSSGEITLNVEDDEGSTTTSSWTISVDNSKFIFIDGDAAGGGDGAIGTPYNHISAIKAGTIAANKIIYFRDCATPYNLRGITSTSSSQWHYRVEFSAANRSIQWMAYPGESPVIDLGGAVESFLAADVNTASNEIAVGDYGDIWATGDWVQLTTTGTLPSPLAVNTEYFVIRVDATHVKLADSLVNAQGGTAISLTTQGSGTHFLGNPYIQFTSHPCYVEGFRWQNTPSKALNLTSSTHYAVIRNNTFIDHYSGPDGNNGAHLMTESGGTNWGDPMAEFTVYQDNVFDTFMAGSGIKLYSIYKCLFENNTIRNGSRAPGSEVDDPIEGLAIKGGSMERNTFRQNTIHDIADRGLDGNANILGESEFLHNLVYNCTNEGVIVNHDGVVVLPLYFYRNTFVCDVHVKYESGDGPFTFTENVIVNNDGANSVPYVTFYGAGTPDATRIVLTNNLTGAAADNIVGATGLLVGSYRDTWLGLRGHELGAPITTTYVIGPACLL